jgi:hypothetical protein
VSRWLAHDRIRLSPTVGCWLHIQVGDTLLVRGELFEVLDRTTRISAKASQVIFKLRHCTEDAGIHASLYALFEGPELQFISSTLTTTEELIELFEEDPVIVPRKPEVNNA